MKISVSHQHRFLMSVIGLIITGLLPLNAEAQQPNTATNSQNSAAPIATTPTPKNDTSSKPKTLQTTTFDKKTVTVPNPYPLSSTVSYDSLRMMVSNGQTEEAIKLAEESLKHRENASIRVLLARMLAWDKKYDAAREQLQFVLKKHPGDYDASDALADVEVWTGNYDQATVIIDNALKYDPKDNYFICKKALIQAKQSVSKGNPDEAIKILETSLKTNNSNDNRLYLAYLLVERKRNDAAKEQYDFILRSKPNNTTAAIGLANVELAQGNKQHALEVIDNGLHYSPNDKDLTKLKEDIIYQINNPNAKPLATSTTSSAAATPAISSPTSGDYAEIKALMNKGQYAKAIKLAKASLAKSDNSDIRIMLGSMLSWEKRYDEARSQFEMVLKESPSNSDASKGLARSELWADNEKHALQVINSALKYHPNDRELIDLKKRAEAAQIGSYDEIRDLERAGKREQAKLLAHNYLRRTENSDVRVLLGYMESWDGNYDDAEEHFKTVLSNSPGYTDASTGLANVQLSIGQPDKALTTINNSLKYHPGDPDLLKKEADIIQGLNSGYYQIAPFPFIRQGNVFLPGGITDKKNALTFNQYFTYADDLKQIWKLSSFQYSRDTDYGPIIFYYNMADRFDSRGTQYVVEAYPHLFDGAYMYLGYGYSRDAFFPKNYYGFEPFFSLPYGFEASFGERILDFRNSNTYLYTGSIGKYYGNYWFSVRPYYSNSGHSFYFIARRYFSSPESYITLRFGGGSGSSSFTDPENISYDFSRSVGLSGQLPLSQIIYFNWSLGYGYEHYPNTNVRQLTDVEAGLTWLF